MDAMASQLVPPNPNASRNCSSSPSGLAIVPFLDDKNIFITGATGFLGKGIYIYIYNYNDCLLH